MNPAESLKQLTDLIKRPENGRRAAANKIKVTMHSNQPDTLQRIGGVDYYIDRNGTRRRVQILGDHFFDHTGRKRQVGKK